MGHIAADSPANRRWVLHIDMDAFFASVEQLTRPTLRGRPVLVGGAGGRGVVAGASYEARMYGARSAMPMHQARRLIGSSAVVVPPRGSVYRAVSRRVFDLIRDYIPVLETLSFDEAFGEPADLANASRDEAVNFAHRLRAAIRDQVGLVASVGLGSGKQVAKIASGMAKPDGVVAVESGREQEFLDPLPVRKLWGIGPVAGDRLQRLGIETIGQFARLSEPEVVSVLGATIGPALHRLAAGHDDRPVAEREQAKQISAESTFADDIISMDRLRVAVDRVAVSAHRRLTDDGRGARTVVLKLKKSDMSVLTRSATLASATTDAAILSAVAARLILDPMEVGPIRLVGVGYSGLSHVKQLDLFPELDSLAGELADSPVSLLAVSDGEAGSDPEQLDSVQKGPDDPGMKWTSGADVSHPVHGHGWVQGSGHGVVTVRFETRTSGPGPVRTFGVDDSALNVADPCDSLDWEPRYVISPD